MARQTRSPADLRNMFGSNLRRLSTQYPSISELSRQLGINRTQFNRYLSGESFPRPDVLDRICEFFGVDARILLEPVETLIGPKQATSHPFLADFLAKGVKDIPDDYFPSGFYRFTRRSFSNEGQYVVGLVYIFRDGDMTFLRGFEAREAMQAQGLPQDARSREFRGYVSQQEEGVAMVVSRRNALTSSFNFLSRINSFENNFWVGYVARPMRETAHGSRVARMVYEYLGPTARKAFPAARKTGFYKEEDLLPFHVRLLQVKEPFR
ncbi:helix-turn-helix domain-containing protein [Seohaeicola zhoushanensis]|uniref:Transcriptional regulator n=1 Tax=Seohaeicola zhoushanensis TaxID=1569283 RepID=A0A8J3M8F1_9RHOB|nr:helix-turn-helix transcriptional regulator [Seohaeicola zhoushanensis]GHF59265.1 transcriptional regulator [Seohaeicola zhoushanensis]